MKNLPRDNFTIGSRLFLSGIALVYLIAFASLWLQVEGLFGSEGIMPIERYFDRLASQENHWSYILHYPSLLWLDHFLKLGNNLRNRPDMFPSGPVQFLPRYQSSAVLASLSIPGYPGLPFPKFSVG